MATSKIDMDQWQCGKALPECLGFMFENEIACDVTFLVGETKTEVRAHKTILISRSPVFYAMLNGPLKETDVITIPDIENDVFKQVLRYIYTDEVNITEETAIPVLYAAKKYCLHGLSKRCVEFLESSMTEENIFVLFEQAHLYDDQNLEDKCMEKIKRNSRKCLESPSFLKLCHTCCQKVVSSDDLCCPEEFIYERVVQWSKAECLRRKIKYSDVNKRKVLAGILYKVRFPLLNRDYYVRHILNNDLLTAEEKLDVVKHHYNAVDSPTMFTNKKRQSYEIAIRFTNDCRTFNWEYNGKSDNIAFRMSKYVILHGVVLYGDNKSSEYNVELSIKDCNGTTLSSIKTKYTASLSDCTSNILLDKSVIIRANTTYRVVALISGPNSKRGYRGHTELSINGVTVTFVTLAGDVLANNGTSVSVGQIPGLLWSEYKF